MKAFITGATGQDGWYLSEFLLAKGYEVFGLVRRSAQGHEIPPGIEVVDGDICEASLMAKIIARIRPQEVYNLAALSHVGQSFDMPAEVFRVNTIGVVNILEAAKPFGCRVYQASTSEMFGQKGEYLAEHYSFAPVSPYAASKVAAHHLVWQYRTGQSMFATAGILFNHESPRRGEDFVTQKIATGIARIRAGLQDKLRLGNLEAKRDWGHAADYVRAMWMILQYPHPEDWVIATGQARSVAEFIQAAWGDASWPDIVETDPAMIRPIEVPCLRGNAWKANTMLKWEPQISFESLVQEMVAAATEKLAKDGHVHHGKDRSVDAHPGLAS